MAVSRFNANFRIREDLSDNITPKALVNREIDRSTGSHRPAAWLPIVFTKHNRDLGTIAFTISAFKPVSLDAQGFVVPAGLKTVLGGNGATGVFAGTVLSYTATDVDWGVTDLTTGLPVVAPVNYTGEQLCDALIERGLVLDDDVIAAGGTVPVASDAHVNVVIDLFVSHPVGIVLQDVLVWAGRADELNQPITNFSLQSGVTFLTVGILRVPQRVAGAETGDAFDAATLDAGGTETYTAGTFIDDGEYWEAAEFSQIDRYSAISSTAPVVALGLAERPVAAHTSRTPFECDTDGVLVRERKSVADISREGDWYLDADVGVVFIHEDTWATLVGAAATFEFSYSFYTDTGLASSQRYIHFDGPCRPGDWVTYDARSNFAVASAAVVGAGLAIGRIHRIIEEPRNLLDKVRTAFDFTGTPDSMKMPGSATQGYTDLITLTPETVANRLVEVKFDI